MLAARSALEDTYVHSESSLMKEFRRLIARHAGARQVHHPLPDVVVAALHAPTPLLPYMAEPIFALVAQGAKRIVLGDHAFRYAPGQYLVVSVDLPVTGHVVQASATEPFLGFGLTLRSDEIAALLLETGAPRKISPEPPGIAVSELSEDLLDPTVRLLRLLDRPADIPVLAPAVRREILWRLINGEQGAMVRQFGLAEGRVAQIGRAIRWIRNHYSETIRIEDLAQMSGMSVTSFHRHFRAVTSLSPIQFQKHIRLQEARSRLFSSSPDIAAVGFAVGYESPSQFSREYRRQFGVSPGQDAERLRQSGDVSEAAY